MDDSLAKLKTICRVFSPLLLIAGVVCMAAATMAVVALIVLALDPDAFSDLTIENFDGEVTNAMKAGTFVLDIVLFACVAAALGILSRFTRGIVREHSPFIDENARSLRALSATFLVLPIVYVAVYFLVPNVVSAPTGLVVVSLVLAVAFYCMALVYRYGAILQRESDETLRGPMAIILRLDKVMADRKVSLSELAARVGISNVNLSNIKTGKIHAVRFSTLNAICRELGCQPGDILEYREDEDEDERRRFLSSPDMGAPMIQNPRGTRDFLPDEMERRRFFEGRLRAVARSFGYREVATPMFEDSELFVLRSGPGVLKELYEFEDKGGRSIALRPEMTAPVVRMFVNGMSNDPKPVKVFYFGQCFRYERPQSGRYREFFQFGAEIIGGAGPQTDAEAVATAAAMLKSLGLRDYRLRIGHIGVLRSRLADAGVPQDRAAEVLQKLDKKLYDEARPLLEGMGVSAADAESIFELTETVGGPEVLDRVPGEAGDWLRSVVSYLGAMGVPDVEIDLGVVRGLDYYTGMVFEAEAPALGAEKQICGGGSYSLSELFGGEKVFSTGFAVGFDRALLALEKEGVPWEPEGIDAYVLCASDDVREEAAGIAAGLRAAGVSADMDIMGRKMAKALKAADSAGARYAVIVGARDLENGEVTVRDLATGEQRQVGTGELAAALRACRARR